MSYKVYTTDAIVCGSFASNTADKTFLLFTKAAGMVYASARSVREERSRQRYALQDFSYISVSLINGKTGWRIGSVDAIQNFYAKATGREERGSVVKIIKHLRRYIQGEEPHPDLFDDIKAGLELLCQHDLQSREAFEQFLMARLLYRLGYVALPSELTGSFIMPLKLVSAGEYSAAAAACEPLLANAHSSSHL